MGEEDPATQAYPAVHAPLHTLDVAPAFPNLPGSQLVQEPAPARENWPAGQMAAVALVEPATHA